LMIDVAHGLVMDRTHGGSWRLEKVPGHDNANTGAPTMAGFR
jgi:hypothetical protein